MIFAKFFLKLSKGSERANLFAPQPLAVMKQNQLQGAPTYNKFPCIVKGYRKEMV